MRPRNWPWPLIYPWPLLTCYELWSLQVSWKFEVHVIQRNYKKICNCDYQETGLPRESKSDLNPLSWPWLHKHWSKKVWLSDRPSQGHTDVGQSDPCASMLRRWHKDQSLKNFLSRQTKHGVDEFSELYNIWGLSKSFCQWHEWEYM